MVPVVAATVVLVTTAALDLGTARSHAAVSSHAVVSSTLHAYVHEDDSIGLTYDDGSPVNAGSTARIPVGTYTVRVIDDADIHNFHLFGQGVDKATTVGESSSPTWTVTFQPGGQYTFQCDVHSDFMVGYFQASGTAPTTTTSTTTKSTTINQGMSPPEPVTLAATVNTVGKVAFTHNGKTVTKLPPGRYRVTAVDRSKTHGFIIRLEGRVHRALTITTAVFVGKRSKWVYLTAGRWTPEASGGGKPAHGASFMVS